MIEFLAGAGALYAYQKRDKWLPKVKEHLGDLKDKFFKGKKNETEKDIQPDLFRQSERKV